MTKSLSFILFCIVITGNTSISQAAGNVAAGKSKAAVCAGCHGADGNSPSPAFPRLAGQHAVYLSRQLTEFKEHKRVDASMEALAGGLSNQDIGDLSAYFASQKAIIADTGEEQYVDEDEEIPVTPTMIEQGKVLYKAGNAETAVAACSACHGPGGDGDGPAGFPGISGQFLPYVIKSLINFKEAGPSNSHSAIMGSIARKMTKEEIYAVSAYVSSLR